MWLVKQVAALDSERRRAHKVQPVGHRLALDNDDIERLRSKPDVVQRLTHQVAGSLLVRTVRDNHQLDPHEDIIRAITAVRQTMAGTAAGHPSSTDRVKLAREVHASSRVLGRPLLRPTRALRQGR